MNMLVHWIAQRFRPREGWFPFFLILAAVLCLPAALLIPGPHTTPSPQLLALAVLAVVAGIRLAHSSLSSRVTGLLVTLLGAILSGATVARLWPPSPLLWRDLANTFSWLQGSPGAQRPFSFLAAFLWQRLSAFGMRLWWWSQHASSGLADQDTIVFELLLALIVWLLALLATWQVFRHQAVLSGLLPAGTVLTIVAFFRGGLAILYFFVFLALTLILLAVTRVWTSRARWEASNIDYPDGLALDLALALVPLVLVILLIAAIFPVFRIGPLHEAYWRVMNGPWSRVEHVAERFFGPIDSQIPRLPGRTPGSGELPQAHLLGAGPELGDTFVLYVATNDPPPPLSEPAGGVESAPDHPRRYWRGAAYDIYTGLGWTSSATDSEAVPAGRVLDPDPLGGFELIQHCQMLLPGTDTVFAANSPYRLDQPVQAWWRAPGDLALLTGALDEYTAISRVPQPSVADLRASAVLGASLSHDMAARYLQLPAQLPGRVVELSRQVAADAGTRYDVARSIEAFLRTYPYKLDLPEPPSDRDIVDYFLFDVQEGYCDYYASAMVVMSRAVGVPARLATGYAQGTYDPGAQRWVVTEEDGHSWPEVYFDGIGWVEFEPTAGLAAVHRPGGDDDLAPAVPSRPTRTVRWWQPVPWPWIGMGLLAALLGILLVWLWRPRHRPGGQELVLDRYARLLRWGRRLRHPLHDGQTPLEYGKSLARALGIRAGASLWQPLRQAGEEASQLVEHLTSTYVRVRYGARPIDDGEQWHIREQWTRLRRRLWSLWLSPRRRTGPDD